VGVLRYSYDNGASAGPVGNSAAFVYANGTVKYLGTLLGGYAQANAINGAGTIVGASDGRAFIYSGGAMADLNAQVQGLPTTLVEAAALNSLGQIVANGSNGHSYLLNPTPLAYLHNAGLVSLALSAGTLAPPFTNSTKTYAASVLDSTSSLTVAPILAAPTATVTVNGTMVSSTTGIVVPLALGDNLFQIVVTASDGTTHDIYTVTIRRQSAAEAAWRQQYFGYTSNVGDAAWSANPAKDGVSNLQKFAFGLNPSASGTSPLQYGGAFANATLVSPGMPITVKQGGDIRMVFMRRADYVTTHLTYKILFSTNLNTPLIASTEEPVVLASNGIYEIVSVAYPQSALAGGMGFSTVQIVAP
jgi:hypothetical protein